MSADPRLPAELRRWADACILPGFDGPRAPDWLRRRIAEGVRGVVLYHANMAGPEALAQLTAELRAENPDLIIGLDEEGGDVTRLHLTEGSPWPGHLTLGQADDPDLTRRTARSIGSRLAELGVNLDLAPVVDVNTAAGNPVIGTRSFGADPARVAAQGAAYVEGLQSTGVAGCAKHFPGHGATTVDSHHDLPRVTEEREAFEEIALPPFRAAIAADVAAVMTAHILLPCYDTVPATISRTLLTGVLRERLGFTGAVITDSLEMRAVHDRYGIAGTALRAVAAGADALCVGTRHGEARAQLLREELVGAVLRGELAAERLAEAAARVEALAARAVLRPAGAPPSSDAGPPAEDGAGLRAARQALLVREVPVLRQAPVVLEFQDEPTPAIGDTAWGLGSLLAEALAGTEVLDVLPDAAPSVGHLPAVRPIVAVVRDLHRHPATLAAVTALLAARPRTVLVEMGLPHHQPHSPGGYLATYGASRVAALAAAEVLLGTAPPATPCSGKRPDAP
ncbi:glycoside hydrolase family 3 protein [Kitasatospora nipponensis]|uniref:Glycoside hydrolase family 3 protein n=1 Tax=Kitasatospora nipponensis TaxID=258049 RepID=A0ABP4HAX3_9ACTN